MAHMSALTQKRFLDALILLVGTATIGASLFFAAVDRPLLTASVGLIGAVPLALLGIASGKLAPPADAAERARRQRSTALSIAVTGAVVTVAGAVLLATTLQTLATVLLLTGPGFLIGGVVALRLIGHPDDPRSSHAADTG